MKYDVYPCDYNVYGECPKACQDCANCVGWNYLEEEEVEEEE